MSSTTAISEPCDIQSQTDTQRIGGNAEMAALRNLYELPYLAQFVTVNKVKFGFPTVDTEILEECLLVQGGDLLISDIAARILRHTLKNPAVRAKNFESHLIKLVESKSPSWNPLSNTEFNKLPAADKLKLLKWLADETKEKKDEIQDLLSEDVENLKNLEDKEIRVGQDSENRIYWYFQGTAASYITYNES
ncbi:hypothetical protein EB796_012891 [Bugula neritina]|uniref:WHIM2 domain-containing protein n=1 Tax=Bugula neritina TaxID=10212 RepID=A0A7J7JR28_BUGNE|nr:hypothetical protein EB796_012891 [Bugula neritina]